MTTTTRIVLACAAAMMLAPAAAHAGTLDQSQTGHEVPGGIFGPGVINANDPGDGLAQMFTAGLTGDLDEARLFLQQYATNNSGSLTVQIRDVPTVDGPPGTGVLATTAVAARQVPAADAPPTFVPVMFDPPAPVTAGNQYSIVAYTTQHEGYLWFSQFEGETGPYLSGTWFNSNESPPTTWNYGFSNYDFAFKTYVKQATNLVAHKAIRGALKITFSATLTRFDGAALAGKPVAFKVAGSTVCSASTNASGKASCSAAGLVIGSGSYTATFAGDSDYLPASATGSL